MDEEEDEVKLEKWMRKIVPDVACEEKVWKVVCGLGCVVDDVDEVENKVELEKWMRK